MFIKDTSTVLQISEQEIWSLEAIKNYMRVSHKYDDDLIRSLINTAVTSAENFTALSLRSKLIKLVSIRPNKRFFRLNAKPIIEIKSVEYKRLDKAIKLTPEQYILDVDHLRITEQISCDSISIEYLAGLDASKVPEPIKHGILLHVAAMYDREEQSGGFFATEVRSLYYPYRYVRV